VARVQESHKGHDIVIEEPAGGGERRALAQAAQEEPLLSIDERPVKVIRHPDGTYSSEGVLYPHSAPPSTFLRVFFSTRT
jgi:hypothetical protein